MSRARRARRPSPPRPSSWPRSAARRRPRTPDGRGGERLDLLSSAHPRVRCRPSTDTPTTRGRGSRGSDAVRRRCGHHSATCDGVPARARPCRSSTPAGPADGAASTTSPPPGRRSATGALARRCRCRSWCCAAGRRPSPNNRALSVNAACEGCRTCSAGVPGRARRRRRPSRWRGRPGRPAGLVRRAGGGATCLGRPDRCPSHRRRPSRRRPRPPHPHATRHRRRPSDPEPEPTPTASPDASTPRSPGAATRRRARRDAASALDDLEQLLAAALAPSAVTADGPTVERPPGPRSVEPGHQRQPRAGGQPDDRGGEQRQREHDHRDQQPRDREDRSRRGPPVSRNGRRQRPRDRDAGDEPDRRARGPRRRSR